MSSRIGGAYLVLYLFLLFFYLHSHIPPVLQLDSQIPMIRMWSCANPNFVLESGELPLMRDLPSAPVKLGITSMNLFRVKPDSGFSSMSTINHPYQTKHSDQFMKMRNEHASVRNQCRDTMRCNKQAYLNSQAFSYSSPRRSWDLGKDSHSQIGSSYLHQHRTRSLDTLGILDDTRMGKHVGTSLLNWENGNANGNIHGRGNCSSNTSNYHTGFLACEEAGLARNEQGPETFLKQRISSLVAKEYSNGLSRPHSKTGSVMTTISSPLAPTHLRRTRRPRKTMKAITLSSEEAQMEQYLHPLDNGMDSTEITTIDVSKYHRRCKSGNSKHSTYHVEVQDAMIRSELQLTQTRENDSPPFQKEKDVGLAPLPLLTEVEDYNESDDISLHNEGDTSCLPLSKDPEVNVYSSSLERNDNEGEMDAEKVSHHIHPSIPDELPLSNYHPRSLSQKYRPKLFEEVIGQHIVTHSLCNAISLGKIAPVYLFHGSRGTGKTTIARIFAAALTCVASEERRPCITCRSCAAVAAGKSSDVKEVDAASNNGIARVRMLLDETISSRPQSRYKVFIIDECHALTTETWNALLQILEEPPMNVVFILITTNPDKLPRTAVSRCQRFPFLKIKEIDIVKRLQQLAIMENLEIDMETLQIIASQSDGSLRDAVTTLDQLSLFGKKMSSSAVYELVGSASDDSLMDLLNSSLMADVAGTVQRARALVDSGIEPLSLMSRLATLVTDILAGSYSFTDKQKQLSFFHKPNLSENDLERLRMVMKILSEAEKQLRDSNDKRTWLTAALLQLGPNKSFSNQSSSNGSPVANSQDTDHSESSIQWVLSLQDRPNEIPVDDSKIAESKVNTISTRHNHSNEPSIQFQAQEHTVSTVDRQSGVESPSKYHRMQINRGHVLSSSTLEDVWFKVLDRCWPSSLRQLLQAHGKLITISMSEVDAVVHIEVSDPENKSRFERCHNFIAQAFESILCFPVQVQINPPSTKECQPMNGPHAFMDHCKAEQFSVHINRGIPEGQPQLNLLKHQSKGPKNLSPNLETHERSTVKTVSSHKINDCKETQQVKTNCNQALNCTKNSELDTIPENGTREQVDSVPSNNKLSSARNCNKLERPLKQKNMDKADQGRTAEQKKKSNSQMTMVRRLTLKSRILSLPTSDPNSPMSSSSAAVKINPSSNCAAQRKSKGEARVPVTADPKPARVNILKEAAGTFARFFMGSKGHA